MPRGQHRLLDRVRHRLAVQLLQLGLVVEGVDLRRAADHEEEDHGLGRGLEIRRARREGVQRIEPPGLRGAARLQQGQRRERQPSKAGPRLREKVAPRAIVTAEEHARTIARPGGTGSKVSQPRPNGAHLAVTALAGEMAVGRVASRAPGESRAQCADAPPRPARRARSDAPNQLPAKSPLRSTRRTAAQSRCARRNRVPAGANDLRLRNPRPRDRAHLGVTPSHLFAHSACMSVLKIPSP